MGSDLETTPYIHQLYDSMWHAPIEQTKDNAFRKYAKVATYIRCNGSTILYSARTFIRYFIATRSHVQRIRQSGAEHLQIILQYLNYNLQR